MTSSAAYILGEIVSNKVDAAQPLIKIFIHNNKIIPLIRVLAEWEISKTTLVNSLNDKEIFCFIYFNYSIKLVMQIQFFVEILWFQNAWMK